MMLDRRVTLELAAETRDPAGDILNPPPPAVSEIVWALRDDDYARRRLLSGRETSNTNTTFTIRYREDLSTKFELVHNTRRFLILGFLERGRREYLDLLCSETR
jgi:head-tail adaptor